MSGHFLTPHDNDFEVWPCSQGTGSKAGFCCQSTTVIDTHRDHPHVQSVLQPASTDSNPSPQLELKETKENDSFTSKLLLSPLPFDTRRHSDSSVVLSPERESDDALSKSWGSQYCIKHAPLTQHPLCTVCLSLFLSWTRTKTSPSPCASVPTPCMCAGQPVSPTGLLLGVSGHRDSLNGNSDLSKLNRSLEDITGHKHVPKPALVRVPSMVFKKGPYWAERGHGDQHEMTETLSFEQMPKPAVHRRASVCMGDLTFMYPVGWTADVLYCLWLKWALCCCRRKHRCWCFEGFCFLPNPPFFSLSIASWCCLHIIFLPRILLTPSPNPYLISASF